MKKSIPIVLLSILTYSCTMKNKAYQELHKHEGTKNYEVVTLIPKQNKANYIRFDTVQNLMIPKSYHGSSIKEKITYESLKVDYLGNVIDTYESHTPLKNGTMKGFNYYSNWILNGDKTKHFYIDPFTDKPIKDLYDYEWPEKDYEEWFEMFHRLYDRATYVHIDISFYFFKIDNKWYALREPYEETPKDFNKLFPAKEDQDVRMVEFRDLLPDFTEGEKNRDTSFMNVVDYKETDSEDGGWFNPISYSAGYYFIELYMPMGDTIKIKRHGSMGANLEVIKIPVTHGGRNDVVFIVQKPGKLYPEKEFGGMYVVRPRNLEQNEHSTHKSGADSFTSQFRSGRGKIDTVAKFLKSVSD